MSGPLARDGGKVVSRTHCRWRYNYPARRYPTKSMFQYLQEFVWAW